MSPVPSTLPSSTTMISRRAYALSSSVETHCAMLCASLRAGTMIETNGAASSAGGAYAAIRGRWRSSAGVHSTNSAQGTRDKSSVPMTGWKLTAPPARWEGAGPPPAPHAPSERRPLPRGLRPPTPLPPLLPPRTKPYVAPPPPRDPPAPATAAQAHRRVPTKRRGEWTAAARRSSAGAACEDPRSAAGGGRLDRSVRGGILAAALQPRPARGGGGRAGARAEPPLRPQTQEARRAGAG